MNKIMKKKGKFRVEMQESNGGAGELGRTRRLHCQSSDSRGMKRGGRTSTRGALLCDLPREGCKSSARKFRDSFFLDAPRRDRFLAAGSQPVVRTFLLSAKNLNSYRSIAPRRRNQINRCHFTVRYIYNSISRRKRATIVLDKRANNYISASCLHKSHGNN